MSDIATKTFWDDLNHWRMHAKRPAMEPRPIELGGVLPKVRSLMLDAKAGWDDTHVASERYVHSPSAPDHQARLVFALECLSRVLTRPAEYDSKTHKETKPAVNGWDVVETILSECHELAARSR